LATFIAATLQEALWGSIAIMLLVILHGFISKALVNLERIRFILLLIFIASTIVWSLNLDGKTPFYFGLKLEPFLYGVGTGLKLDAMIISGLIFLSTATNEELSLALVRLKIPYRLTFAFTTALRLVPTFVGTALTVAIAQKSRGVELESGNIFARLKKYLPLLGPVLLMTLRYTMQLSMALESKSFGGIKKRTFYLQCKYNIRDFYFLIFLLLTVLIFVYWKLSGYLDMEGLIR
ncbi:energy-coupling factor transporter transmembrane protein EcfT, partial [bacterium]|nr:energy-coupling factor transporter transmembrane protein EcfT [bacterium]